MNWLPSGHLRHRENIETFDGIFQLTESDPSKMIHSIFCRVRMESKFDQLSYRCLLLGKFEEEKTSETCNFPKF